MQQVAEKGMSDEQLQAVTAAAVAQVMVLTGGPGCGKTYTTSLITALLTAQGKKVGGRQAGTQAGRREDS